MRQPTTFQCAAIVAAHPDDAEILCFGTIARLLSDGCKVHLIIVCDGNRGISVDDQARLGIESLSPDLRSSEVADAFKGYDVALDFLGFRDDVALCGPLISKIESAIRACVLALAPLPAVAYDPPRPKA